MAEYFDYCTALFFDSGLLEKSFLLPYFFIAFYNFIIILINVKLLNIWLSDGFFNFKQIY